MWVSGKKRRAWGREHMEANLKNNTDEMIKYNKKREKEMKTKKNKDEMFKGVNR